jgi:acetyl esterase/lipase
MTRIRRLGFYLLLPGLIAVAPVAPVFGAEPEVAKSAAANEPKPTLLWSRGAPGAVGTETKDQPSIAVYPAPTSDKASGTAVIIFPGGGYSNLAMDHEGSQVARWFNAQGVTAFVLRYRHAPFYRHPIPIGDAQRAIRTVRSKAEGYHISPDRIGIMGFSAGGHLAATASTRFDPGNPRASDPIDRASSRPDFAILAYPVISFVAPFSHNGSAEALLGKDADPRLLDELSAEKRVTARTPPTFLFHTGDDAGVPVENSIAYYQALRAYKVTAEMHIYQKGKHGVGLAPDDPALSSWPGRLSDWLKARGMLDPPPPCKLAVKGNSPVAIACRLGGKPSAGARMHDMQDRAKARGTIFSCSDCHSKDTLTENAARDFEKLVKLASGR